MKRPRMIVCAAALVLARRAAASEAPIVLEWTAPQGCPTQARVLQEVARIAGGAAPAEALRARVVVAETGDHRWRADVDFGAPGATTSRALEGESCGAVTDAVVVVLAIAIDPHASAASAPREPAPESAPPAPETASVPPTEPPRRQRHFVVGAAGALDGGALPSAVLGVAGILGWRAGRARAELDGSAYASRSATTAQRPNEGASFSLVRVAARGCYAAMTGSIELSPCAGASIDRTVAHGFGSDQPSDASAVVTSGALGVLGLAPISPFFSVRLAGEVSVPFSRPSFVVGGTGLVHRPAVVAARLSLGGELHF